MAGAEPKDFHLFRPIYLQNTKVMAYPQLVAASRCEHIIKALYAFTLLPSPVSNCQSDLFVLVGKIILPKETFGHQK